MQGALQASQQARAQLEQSLQSHMAEVARTSTATVQSAAACQAEMHRLESQAKALQQDLLAARSRADEERAQTKQLASALTAAHDEYQVMTLPAVLQNLHT